jgi:hypothetical protein
VEQPRAPPMREAADIIADGRPREQQLPLRLVRDLNQAQRIGEIKRRQGRLWGRGTVTLPAAFCELEDGDWVRWVSARRGFDLILCIQTYLVDEKWQNTISIAETSATVFDDDGEFEPDESVAVPRLPPPDIGTPDGVAWALSAELLSSAGADIPALVITGATSDNDQAEAVIVEYWLDDGVGDPVADPDSVAWTMVGRYAPNVERVEITSLVGGETYYVAISYVVSGITGDRLVLGPATVGELDISTQAATAVGNLSWKAPVRAATTANGTLATAFENGDTIDGVVLATGDRILLKDQTTGSQNGIYTVNASGAPTRATDADTGAELVCATVRVSEGTANADSEWSCTTNAPITVGATALAWSSTRSSLGLLRLIAFFFTTTPTASEVLGIYPAVDAFTLPANLAGTQVKVGTNPAATFAIDIQQNGATIAGISVATGGAVTLTTVGGTAKAIAPGDVIKAVAPGTADTTIANVAVNIKGTL